MSQQDVKAAMMKSIEAIQSNPKAASVFFKATTQLEEDVRCTAQVRNFAPIVIDEPPELGGKNAGPNPVEMLLVALGTCQEIMYAAYASVMGVKLDSVKVDLKGDIDLRGLFGLDENIPAGYTRINFVANIESDADEDTLRTLIEKVEAHCPVMDSLAREMSIHGVAKVNGKELYSSDTKIAV